MSEFVDLLKKAFEAGEDRGYDNAAANYWGDSTTLPTFPEFMAELGLCPVDGDAMPCFTCGAGL